MPVDPITRAKHPPGPAAEEIHARFQPRVGGQFSSRFSTKMGPKNGSGDPERTARNPPSAADGFAPVEVRGRLQPGAANPWNSPVDLGAPAVAGSAPQANGGITSRPPPCQIDHPEGNIMA